jgi:hypothetical protein
LVAVNNMIPWGLLGQGVKAGLEIYKNKKKSEVAMSEAQLLHAEKMKRGEIEYSGQIMQNQKSRLEGRICTFDNFFAFIFVSIFCICRR